MESRFVLHHIRSSEFLKTIHPCDLVCRCHLGKTIVYDTVSNLSWSANVRTHGIVTVIEKVLGEPWLPSVDMGREVPEPAPQDDCVVC
jgi:putative lipase involved disintegration of autophagic bodies